MTTIPYPRKRMTSAAKLGFLAMYAEALGLTVTVTGRAAERYVLDVSSDGRDHRPLAVGAARMHRTIEGLRDALSSDALYLLGMHEVLPLLETGTESARAPGILIVTVMAATDLGMGIERRLAAVSRGKVFMGCTLDPDGTLRAQDGARIGGS